MKKMVIEGKKKRPERVEMKKMQEKVWKWKK